MTDYYVPYGRMENNWGYMPYLIRFGFPSGHFLHYLTADTSKIWVDTWQVKTNSASVHKIFQHQFNTTHHQIFNWNFPLWLDFSKFQLNLIDMYNVLKKKFKGNIFFPSLWLLLLNRLLTRSPENSPTLSKFPWRLKFSQVYNLVLALTQI